MKKVEKAYSRSFEPVTLYLDHLEEIVGILQQEGWQVTISSPTHVFESVQDFAENQHEKLSDLTIQAEVPDQRPAIIWQGGITISFRDSYASIAAMVVSHQVWAVCSKVAEILDGAKRGVLARWASVITYPVIVVAGSFVGIVVALSQPRFTAWFLAFLAMWVTGITLTTIGTLKVTSARHTIIYPWHKRKHSTFWTRNRDAILLNVVTSSATFFGGLITGQLTQKPAEKPPTPAVAPTSLPTTGPAASRPTTQP